MNPASTSEEHTQNADRTYGSDEEYNVEEYSAKVYKTKPVEFTNVSTGEVIEYSSVKLAWRTTGITPRTIYK